MLQNRRIDSIEDQLAKIKLFAFDVDGVLTNGDITYTESGEEIKSFNAKDGQGINMLVKGGYLTAIITARESNIIARRAQDLGIADVFQGSKNKILAVQALMEKYGLDLSEIAYAGDDLPDMCVLEKVGLAFCPLDAVEEVKQICHFISSKEGGKGAVREVTDLLLKRALKTV